MKYKLKDHVTDEMLIACGFEITNNYYGRGDSDDCFEAIRKIDEAYDVVLQDRTKQLEPMLYDKYADYRWENPYTEEDITPYIQDLIELGYVEESQ